MKKLRYLLAAFALAIIATMLVPSDVFAAEQVPVYIDCDTHTADIADDGHYYVYKIQGDNVFYYKYFDNSKSEDNAKNKSAFEDGGQVGKIYHDDSGVLKLDSSNLDVTYAQSKIPADSHDEHIYIADVKNGYGYIVGYGDDGEFFQLSKISISQIAEHFGITDPQKGQYYYGDYEEMAYKLCGELNKNYTYKFTNGDNQEFEEGKISGYTFTVDGDHTLFDVLVIGELRLVKETDYNVTEGSTKITFTASGLRQLNTLTKGTYDVFVRYTNSQEAIGKLIIKEANNNNNSNNNNSPANSTKSPKTGEELPVVLLGFLAMVGVALTVVSKKRA